MRLRLFLDASVVVATTLLCAADARADDVDPIEACATTAEQAMDARQVGRYAEALAQFRSCARDVCPALVRDDCRTALSELAERAPRLSFRVRDGSGKDAPAARILVDARPLSEEERTGGVILDAGTHVVEVVHDGTTVRREVVVAAGDAARTVEIALAPSAGVVAPPPADLQVNRLPAAIVGGVGIASLGVAGVFGVWSYVDFQDYEDTCSPSCDPADVSASRTRGVVADVALGIGLNAVLAATILFFAGPKVAREGTNVAFRF